jgi:CheY-like chemotaxis protein
LLVEDHAPLAEATAWVLRSKGLDVRLASTGREALEVAATYRPEIVLCDMRLPDMSGLDVARGLRAIPGAKDAVIAIHSLMTEHDLGALSAHAAAPLNLFVPKPITEEKIDALISRLQSHALQKKKVG